MAKISELLEQVEDKALRARLQEEFDRVSKTKKFGLVFEDHIPECTPLYGIAIKIGSNVAKKAGQIKDVYTVVSIDGTMAKCYHKPTKETVEIPLEELVPVAQFGEPIFPMLQPIDSIQNAPDSTLWHTLIEADNYHALQLLEYLYAGKVDCIYIDPPYNTGAHDWKYNNDYVDSADSFRHSKWLSMMDKRLVVAKRLLRADGVMIITIDDNEYATLSLLLEKIYPEPNWKRATICIQMNPGGTQGKAFSVTNEFAIVLYREASIIYKRAHMGGDTYNLRRWGSTSGRYEGATCFYPIIVNEELKIIGFGDVLEDSIHPASQVEKRDDGNYNVWPIDISNTEKKWRYARNTVESIYDRLFVERRGERLEIIVRRETEPPKTMWVSNAYNAEAYGTDIIKAILGKDQFTYPKSLYAERDCLALAVAGKPDALIIDFFAGSGTTLHAVNLLNLEDNGHRRCILVTNNEVSEMEEKKLRQSGLRPGDPEWEARGVARNVTWKRTKFSILGKNVSGTPLVGNYGVEHEDYETDEESAIISRSTGKPLKKKEYKKIKVQEYPILAEHKMSDGFEANVEYFKLGFLDRDRVSLGQQFKEVLPLLWLKAGAVGKRPEMDEAEPDMLILPENGFAVLVDETMYASFLQQVKQHHEIKMIFFVTDSEEAFREMSAGVTGCETFQLYRDYIDNFVLGSRRA